MTTTPNTDAILERLRERQEDRDYCAECQASITETDIDNGACTQCGHALGVDEEDLYEDSFSDDNALVADDYEDDDC